MIIDIIDEDYIKLQSLMADMNSYYEDIDRQWNIVDLDNQREIGCQIIGIIGNYIQSDK